MAKNDKQLLLDKYKAAEALINQVAVMKNGSSTGFLGAEEYCEKNGDEENKAKLRILRLMRNFIVHTPGGAAFLSSEKAQLDYLDAICKECSSYLDTVAKHFSRAATATCVPTDSVADIMAAMAKQQRLYMGVLTAEKKPLDIVSLYELIDVYAVKKSAKIGRDVLRGRKQMPIICVKNDVLMSDVPDGNVVFITKDGTAETACTGVVKR